MNIYSRHNQLTWKVVRWYAEHSTSRFTPMWELVINDVEENPSHNFIDGINYVKCYHNDRIGNVLEKGCVIQCEKPLH